MWVDFFFIKIKIGTILKMKPLKKLKKNSVETEIKILRITNKWNKIENEINWKVKHHLIKFLKKKL